MNWPHGDPDAVARRVLADAAYRQATASTAAPPRSLLQMAWDWFVHSVLGPLVGPLSQAFEASRNIGTAVGIVLVPVALLAIAFVVVRLALAFGRRGGGRTALETGALPGGATFAATDWRAVAREAAARGEYARAIAALWAAALVLLDERALVTLDPARTPGEYRRSVRRIRSAAAAPFDTLGERFVQATYAAAASSVRDFEIAESAFTAFEPAATPA